MRKRNREQLRAAIANDLVKDQGGHSPTRELLRQYAPLKGIVTKLAPAISAEDGCAEPVENSLALHATVARNDQRTMARCYGSTGCHRSIRCHRGTICRSQRRVEGTEYDQLQPLSDPRPFREGRLLPALSLVAWLQARPLRHWSCEVGCRSPYVLEESAGYSYLLGKTRSH